ncbi:MAG TPA: hypothetical protein VFP96_17250 [Candidatus Acidoferrum sp.]|jgi:hypothetical protein|nr:hypothetical protein [Candidatus Acidoferrum sp.]
MNETHQQNLMQPRGPSLIGTTLWSGITGITAFLCFILALAAPKSVRIFHEMFQGLGVELPWLTSLFLAIYKWLLPAFYLGLALCVFLVQFSGRDFRTKRLYTVRILLATLVSLGFVVFILYLPLLTVASKLIDTK